MDGKIPTDQVCSRVYGESRRTKLCKCLRSRLSSFLPSSGLNRNQVLSPVTSTRATRLRVRDGFEIILEPSSSALRSARSNHGRFYVRGSSLSTAPVALDRGQGTGHSLIELHSHTYHSTFHRPCCMVPPIGGTPYYFFHITTPTCHD